MIMRHFLSVEREKLLVKSRSLLSYNILTSRCIRYKCLLRIAVSVTFIGLDLESGAQYTVIIRAVNLAGLHIEATSDGFIVDFTPPTASEARLGTGTEPVTYQSDLGKLVIR